ncbi:hypothetical protein ACODT5_15890 [Streptomyces sp. 5.8]|uniref:hypothetical protein n=1 Tax=Streptomyces sp. 5.8 TaxID=3406571 RepID=UPI003BB5922F
MATPADQATGPTPAADARTGAGAMPLWGESCHPMEGLDVSPGVRFASRGTAGFDRPELSEANDWPEFEEAMAAWDDLVPALPAAEIRTAVAKDVAVLQPDARAAAEIAPAAGAPGVPKPAAPPAPPAEPPVAAPAAPEVGAAVATALAGADTHADRLKDHPEWQRIQTVRGAFGHVWDVMKEKAGPYWDDLRADVRFQGFWKTASIRACEAIAASASTLARRLQGDLPAADALLKLSDATLTYSDAAARAEPAPGPAAKPAAKETADSAEVPMPQFVERKAPMAYATREDSVRGAEEVTKHFQDWITSPMGRELVTSDHRRVAEFRDAWQQLPPHESGPGPAVGPYGNVAERAKALVTAAVGSARFAPGDLQALQTLAHTADRHAARLAVTLPPGTATPTQKAAAPAPRVAVSQPAATRGPRAAV